MYDKYLSMYKYILIRNYLKQIVQSFCGLTEIKLQQKRFLSEKPSKQHIQSRPKSDMGKYDYLYK